MTGTTSNTESNTNTYKVDSTQENENVSSVNESKVTHENRTEISSEVEMGDGRLFEFWMYQITFVSSIDPEGLLSSHQSQAEDGSFDSPDKDAIRARKGKTPVDKKKEIQKGQQGQQGQQGDESTEGGAKEVEDVKEVEEEEEIEDEEDTEPGGLGSKIKAKGAKAKSKVRYFLLSSNHDAKLIDQLSNATHKIKDKLT